MQIKHNKTWHLALGAVLGSVMLAGCGSSDSDDEASPTARQTQAGAVQGTEEAYGYAFKGIPYAQPPVGELRYAAPQPAEAWEGTLEATEFGGSCIQPASTFGTSDSTEDCLYLNVYTPSDADGSTPVMVWIHGGAFETGSGNDYNPASLVNEDVVVVTINYRLGVLGFLSHPDLATESPNGATGSYGLMDQQLALRWVQDNIESFGGDPDNVTIFGESAGGLSVMSHVVSPASAQLFDKAIVQSGAYAGTQPSQPAVETGGQAFFNALECSDIECIRGLDASVIREAQTAADLSFLPSLRYDILPQSIGVALDSGEFNRVPMMAGVNRDEWRLFVAIEELTTGTVLQPADYTAEVEDLLGVSTAQAQGIIDNFYPLASEGGPGYENTSIAVSAIGTDVVFACPGLDQIDVLTQNSGYPVYGYEFADRDAPSIIGTDFSFDPGAAHAFEIQYVFGSDESRAASGMNEDQVALARTMTDHWANFAKTGNPNATDDPDTMVAWPMFNQDRELIEFVPNQVATLSEAAFSGRHKCAVWSAD